MRYIIHRTTQRTTEDTTGPNGNHRREKYWKLFRDNVPLISVDIIFNLTETTSSRNRNNFEIQVLVAWNQYQNAPYRHKGEERTQGQYILYEKTVEI